MIVIDVAAGGCWGGWGPSCRFCHANDHAGETRSSAVANLYHSGMIDDQKHLLYARTLKKSSCFLDQHGVTFLWLDSICPAPWLAFDLTSSCSFSTTKIRPASLLGCGRKQHDTTTRTSLLLLTPHSSMIVSSFYWSSVFIHKMMNFIGWCEFLILFPPSSVFINTRVKIQELTQITR